MIDRAKVLERAIQSAIDGGWQLDFTKIKHYRLTVAFEVEKPFNKENPWSANDIIFNHNFAKALWPQLHALCRQSYSEDDFYKHICIYNPSCTARPDWQFHLQQLAIADDPILYLSEHLPEGK